MSEEELREERVGINGELAALGWDPSEEELREELVGINGELSAPGWEKQMRDQLESINAQSSHKWSDKRRQLMKAKNALNKHNEPYTSTDEDEYHRELWDRKLQVHEALRVLVRRP